MKRHLTAALCLILCFLTVSVSLSAQSAGSISASPQEAFDKPNLLTAKELYRLARETMASGQLDAARLYALRLYFDGNRSQNLLNLLGVIELQAGRPLLAAEWLRKASSLSLVNKVAQRYLSRLPARPRPIPVDQTKLADHFGEISEALPKLLERLANPKLHFDSVMKAIERGQIYLALALSEEYEKKYPGPEGSSLTALCAWYLGRNRDALNLVEQGLTKAPHNPILLFVKAMINDPHPGTSAGNYFRALYDVDQWNKALSLVDQFSKANPNSPDAYITQARIMLELHKIKEAGQALQEAGVRDPGNPEIELLWVGYLLQREESDKASKRLARAFRRGYNMPSVSLAAGLFALQGGRANELNVILNDAAASRPFTDPEAYPTYISLLLLSDRMPEARNALDEWRARSSERSMICYLESYYCFKTGDNIKALEWLRKGFQQNPNRLDMLKFLAGFPALGDDLALFAEINNRLASAAVPGFTAMPVPEVTNTPSPLPQSNPMAVQPVGVQAASGGSMPVSGDGMFQITLGPGLDPSGRTMIASELAKMYERIASRIGTLSVPIFVNFLSAEGLGPTIALYEPQNTALTVTSAYYDSEMIRNIILANFDALSDEELGTLIEEYPGHLLAGELTRLIIQILIPEAKTNKDKTAWMQIGLAEILAGSSTAQRYRMLVAQKSLESKVAKLASANMVNSIFAEGYTSPAVFETATAQAYLMTAFLVKKSGNLEKGCRDMMKLIELVSKGSEFGKVLNEVFKISEADFEKSWTDAAYWALKQGAPYEW
jgi:tetratricopeptide (TPR) repeat protein